MKKLLIILIAAVIIIILTSVTLFVYGPPASDNPNDILNINLPNEMKIKTVFENNARIPEKYTCNGEDISPQLDVSGIPKNAKTLAVIVDDPDAPAGTWLHWTIWNIEVTGSNANISEGESPGTEGKNDFGDIEYGGPCPPSGTHRYFFKVYALDIGLSLEKGASKQQLEKAMQGHILDKAEIIGIYSKK